MSDQYDGPEMARQILRLQAEVTKLRQAVLDERDAVQARVKLLEDAMKYIFKETQNTGYGNAIVMERMIDRIEECAINALSNLSGEIDGN